MDEHKYQVIDPDSDKYRITAEDIKKDKKRNKRLRKNRHRALKTVVAIVLILSILIGAGAIYINSKLEKINYENSQGEVHPELDKQESLVFDEQEDADEDIRANLSDNVLWYDDRIYNVLLVGVDYGDEETVMFEGAYLPRSDSMILLSINSINNTINMVSLSRAVYVAIPGHGNKRLNTAHAYGGATTLVDTIELNYKIRIDKYIVVDISGFQEIIDILGGIHMDLTSEEARIVIGQRVAGNYLLDGKRAVSYSRLRSIDSDRKRTGRQRNVLNAIAGKLRNTSVPTMIDLLDEVLPLVTTDFSKTEILSQATKAPKYLGMQIHEDIIPHNATSLSMRDGKEVLILNWPETTAYVHDLLYPDIVPQSAEITANNN